MPGPLELREPQVDRDLPLDLVGPVVEDGRAVGDAAEPVRGLRQEQHGLGEATSCPHPWWATRRHCGSGPSNSPSSNTSRRGRRVNRSSRENRRNSHATRDVTGKWLRDAITRFHGRSSSGGTFDCARHRRQLRRRAASCAIASGLGAESAEIDGWFHDSSRQRLRVPRRYFDLRSPFSGKRALGSGAADSTSTPPTTTCTPVPAKTCRRPRDRQGSSSSS